MKNLFNWLLPVAAIILFGGFVSTGSALQRLNIFFKKLRVKGFTLGRINLLVDMILENPNKRDVTVQEVDAVVEFNARKVASIQLYNRNIVVPARSTAALPDIAINIEAIQAVQEILNLINKASNKTLIISGTVIADKLTFPFNTVVPLSKEEVTGIGCRPSCR
jgi:LEA14-like dessication related protein